MIGPFAYAMIGTIVALIVHLSSILAMPMLSTRDGYQRVAGLLAENHMTLLPDQPFREAVLWSDPAVAVAGCRYMLDKGPVRIRVAAGATPTTLLLLRRGGGIFHSVSDKAATQGVLEVVIATQEQMDLITELDADDEPVQEIRVVAQEETGLALLRGLVPLPSQRGEVEALVAGATCEAETLDREK